MKNMQLSQIAIEKLTIFLKKLYFLYRKLLENEKFSMVYFYR